MNDVPERLPETFDLSTRGWGRSLRDGSSPAGEDTTSYTGSAEAVEQPVTYEWNHGIGEVVQAVLDAGLRLTRLEEHRELEWRFLDWMDADEGDSYTLPEGHERLPLMYSLEAIKE